MTIATYSLQTIGPTEKRFIYYYSPLNSPSNDVIIEIIRQSTIGKKCSLKKTFFLLVTIILQAIE